MNGPDNLAMSNSELAKAIADAHAMMNRTAPNTKAIGVIEKHFYTLLEIQLVRAGFINHPGYADAGIVPGKLYPVE